VALIGLVLTLSSVSAHISLLFPLPRAHPLATKPPFNLSNAEVDAKCITAPLNKKSLSQKCAFKANRFPCGGYKPNKKIVTKIVASQVFNVSFFNLNFEDSILFDDIDQRFFVSKELFDAKHGKDNQGRHNGGLIEFDLSYD